MLNIRGLGGPGGSQAARGGGGGGNMGRAQQQRQHAPAASSTSASIAFGDRFVAAASGGGHSGSAGGGATGGNGHGSGGDAAAPPPPPHGSSNSDGNAPLGEREPGSPRPSNADWAAQGGSPRAYLRMVQQNGGGGDPSLGGGLSPRVRHGRANAAAPAAGVAGGSQPQPQHKPLPHGGDALGGGGGGSGADSAAGLPSIDLLGGTGSNDGAVRSSPRGGEHDNDDASDIAVCGSGSDGVALGGSSSASSTSHKGGGGAAGGGGSEGETIIIHVCDEARQINRDFACQRKVLLHEMRYFQSYLGGDPSAGGFDDIDISVHCDVHIFEWLVQARASGRRSRSSPRVVLIVASGALPVFVGAHAHDNHSQTSSLLPRLKGAPPSLRRNPSFTRHNGGGFLAWIVYSGFGSGSRAHSGSTSRTARHHSTRRASSRS